MKVEDKSAADSQCESGVGIQRFLNQISPSEAMKKAGAYYFPAEQDWHDILDTITDMITIHDSEFNIIHANKAAKKRLGLPVLNKPDAKCYEYYHGSDVPPAGCPSCRCLGTQKPLTFETFEPHLNMHIEIRAIPRLDGDGKVLGLIHIVRDISSRKLREEELQLHRDHLEWMVRRRTGEITAINERLQKEIAEKKRAGDETEQLIKQLREELSKIKKISGWLRMCAWCKKIQDDQGSWKQAEAFICEHSVARFTHGICPSCAGKLTEA